MTTVTRRIKEIKQPRGGYIKPSSFDAIELIDNKVLNGIENIPANIVGTAVDYLTRFMVGNNLEDAFRISIKGIECAKRLLSKRNNAVIQEAYGYLNNIKGLDDNSIISACKLVTYDTFYRNPMVADPEDAKNANPDSATIENIRTMVKRSISFFEAYGPITVEGFTFEPTGYTKTVSAGDGDFLTADTLWDFKVSKAKPTSAHTLQLLMYWIMGQHSGKVEFKDIKRLGIFNPRLNTIYLLDMNKVADGVITEVEKDVICY